MNMKFIYKIKQAAYRILWKFGDNDVKAQISSRSSAQLRALNGEYEPNAFEPVKGEKCLYAICIVWFALIFVLLLSGGENNE